MTISQQHCSVWDLSCLATSDNLTTSDSLISSSGILILNWCYVAPLHDNFTAALQLLGLQLPGDN
jgi:hypothetical protein